MSRKPCLSALFAVLAGDTGCTALPGQGACRLFEPPLPEYEECRSACELQARECPEQPIEQFRSFEEELAEWTRVAEELGCGYHFRVAGECDDGTRLLYARTGEGSIAQFYDAASDGFLGLETLTDNRIPPCNGTGYWPRRIACANPLITQVICELAPGTRGVGDCLIIDSRE